MDLLDYLRTNFITETALLDRCAFDAATLQDWQQRRMLPLPSYRLALDVHCHSFFGQHVEALELRYYPKGCAAWVDAIRFLDNEAQAYGHFAARYRARLAGLNASTIALPEHCLAEEHIASEWEHFLAGTYGVCTLTGLPEEIAAKEAAIAVIKSLSENAVAAGANELAELRRAVDLLDAVSAPFAPHEVARSSRYKYVERVRAAYRL